MVLLNNVKDCALVFEGGGYRAAYTAGIANALLESGIYFDFVCGISAGASHTVDYLSRDEFRVKNAFVCEPGNKKRGGMGSFLRGEGYFRADYLYQGIIDDGTLPFDWDTFAANPARLAIQAFERDTGRTRTFTREDMPTEEACMLRVRASSTLPVLMNPEPIDGVTYLDGGLGDGGGMPLSMAEDAGFQKFFFVATRPAGYRKQPPTRAEERAITRMARDYPHVRRALLTRWEHYNAALDRLARYEAEGRAFVVRPDVMPVKSTTMERDRLEAAYDLGHHQALRDMPQYRAFLFGE